MVPVVTFLSLTDPLRSLRALCGLSHRALGERLMPPVSDVAVVKAEAKGPRIKLATMASYASAAGYVLMLHADKRGCFVGDLDVTVAGARALLAALGLEMTLAVEPAISRKDARRC